MEFKYYAFGTSIYRLKGKYKIEHYNPRKNIWEHQYLMTTQSLDQFCNHVSKQEAENMLMIMELKK